MSEVSLLEGTKEEDGLTDNPVAPRGGGGKKGKKERKKKAFDDEWYVHHDRLPTQLLASFPGLRPDFVSFLHGCEIKFGRRPGDEAIRNCMVNCRSVLKSC